MRRKVRFQANVRSIQLTQQQSSVSDANICIRQQLLTLQNLLQALSKSDSSRVSAIPINAQTPPAQLSQSHSDESHGGQSNIYSPDDSYSSYSTNATTSRTASSSKGGRSVSAATTSASTFGGGQGSVREVRKLEDVIGLSKDRLLNWSYLMQWYGG